MFIAFIALIFVFDYYFSLRSIWQTAVFPVANFNEYSKEHSPASLPFSSLSYYLTFVRGTLREMAEYLQSVENKHNRAFSFRKIHWGNHYYCSFNVFPFVIMSINVSYFWEKFISVYFICALFFQEKNYYTVEHCWSHL